MKVEAWTLCRVGGQSASNKRQLLQFAATRPDGANESRLYHAARGRFAC
jgi:hypothetical protein